MILPNLRQEKRLWKSGFTRLAGVDEVGRGALAGPVVAAAVLARDAALMWHYPPPFPIRDSKRLTSLQRERVYRWLKRHPGFFASTAVIPVRVIDTVNIRNASILAMTEAVRRLPKRPQVLLIDGVDRLPLRKRQNTYIRGDSRVFLIALASIVAKVTRDRLMTRLSKTYPRYGFSIHKGYGTRRHLRALKRLGPSRSHRKTFLSSLDIRKKAT